MELQVKLFSFVHVSKQKDERFPVCVREISLMKRKGRDLTRGKTNRKLDCNFIKWRRIERNVHRSENERVDSRE